MTSSSELEPSSNEPSSPAAENPAPRDALGETQTHQGHTNSGAIKPLAQDAGGGLGPRLGRYEIRHLLGTGGMGVVYKAHDALIERDVAIKILPQEFARDQTSLERFLSEARAAGKFIHPNAVAIYEVGQQDDTYFLVMECVPGGSVGDTLDKTPGGLGAAEATRIAADACRGLAAAHAVGLVHRDIKPANLLRAADGSVKIADFGLAKPVFGTMGQLTQAGQILGTPYYMSPEQCSSDGVDHRSDIYSLGATYYALLTGAEPYRNAGTIVQVMFAHCNGEIPDPRTLRPELPEECGQIIARAMAKDPDDRYQTAGEMLADLEILSGKLSGGRKSSISLAAAHSRKPASRARAWSVAATLAALVGIGSYFLGRDTVSPIDSAPLVAPAVVATPVGLPIRVGILHSLTGTMAESESPVVEATLLAIEELNHSGGLLGRPIEPVVRDGRSDPQVFAAEARNLIVDERVCTVFGCWTSDSRKTVLPIFERHDHLLVYPVQYEGLEESPNVIYLGATPNQQIIPAVKWAFAFRGKRRFFIVGSDYIFPRAASAIIRDVLKELGVEPAGEEYLPLGSFDVKEVVDKVVATKPDMILNLINGDSNIPFFKELRARQITPAKINTISFSVGEAELRHLGVSQMAGDFAAWSYFQSIDTPANRQLVARFQAKYGPQRVVTDPMEAAYVGVKLWAQAVEQAQSAEVAKIRTAFGGQETASPEGPVRIDPATHHIFQTPRIGQILGDGQFEVISNMKSEPPVPFPPSRTRDEWLQMLQAFYDRWGHRWSAPE